MSPLREEDYDGRDARDAAHDGGRIPGAARAASGASTELVEGELVVDRAAAAPSVRSSPSSIYALGGGPGGAPAAALVRCRSTSSIDERNVFAPTSSGTPEGAGPDRHGSPPSPLPHLAVEVRSPSTWRYDIGAKKAAYERAGLRELWLVDTAASEVLVFRRSGPDAPAFDVSLELERDHTLTSPQLDGFELPLAELFPE